MVRWGECGAVSGGVLFLAWGYLHGPDMQELTESTAEFLSFAAPMSFGAALLGVYALVEGEQELLGEIGLILSFIGTMWGSLLGLVSITSERADAMVSHWQWEHLSLFGWDNTLFSGLTLVGIVASRKQRLRGLGVLLVSIAASGWVYYFTDSGAVLEARPVHVGFGLLFAASWVVLGIALRFGEE